jgi:hypothetical protein
MLLFLLSACTTQKIHFHKLTPNNLENVIYNNSLFNAEDSYYLQGVEGGPYPESPNEFSNAVWHLVIQGYIPKYMTLPVKDVNQYILDTYRSVLISSGIKLVETVEEADYVVEFFIDRIVLKTQKASGFDYTACLTRMHATSLSTASKQKQLFNLMGIAKVAKARIEVTLGNITTEKNEIKDIDTYVRYSPGSPTIFELSLAEGLKTLNR